MDGSCDKRVTGNYQVANYNVEYQCKSCGADINIKHNTVKRQAKGLTLYKGV